MYSINYFDVAYSFLSKKCYQKALPYLVEAAQQGHPLAHLWIENIYSNGLDAREPESQLETHLIDKVLLPGAQGI
jgi:TPR repeat protein